MKKQSILRLIATFTVVVMMIMTLASCAYIKGDPGKDGVTPTIEISKDGYWVINGTKTEIKAAGIDGKDGKDGTNGVDGKDGKDGVDGEDGANGTNGTNGTNGVTPTITISDDGYWVINGTKTEYKAIGKDGVDGTPGIDGVDGKPGEDGIDGVTPTIDISEDGYWIINGTKTEYKAIGVDGENGENGSNGVTPTIDISEDGYWIINGVKTDKKAIGIDGTPGIDGVDGKPGEDGIDGTTPTIEISEDGYWIINGTKTEYKAIGVDGENGSNGVTPTIDISEDGYWIINGVKTDKKAIGVDGENGSNGVTPTIAISEDGYWVINSEKTAYKAIGEDGENGVTPNISISEDGYWVINGVKTEYIAGNNCKHNYVDFASLGAPCNSHNVIKMCDKCGKFIGVNEDPVADHVYENLGDALYCKMCGEKGTVNYYRDGNYIYFGEYPQTIKADDVIITDTQDSRGYYLGSDGFYYAAVTATPYGSNYTFSTGDSVTKDEVYYFRVELIRWRILSEGGGSAFILCDNIIANMAYQSSYYRKEGSSNYYTDANGAKGHFASNYKYSTVRKWLNETFYENAFTDMQRELIFVTKVDNSLMSISDQYSSLNESNVCPDTYDKVFLLSTTEVREYHLGFTADASAAETRKMLASDYSRATGVIMDTSTNYYGNSDWWLRSPTGSNYACCINDRGEVTYNSTYLSTNGVVPAMWINLNP